MNRKHWKTDWALAHWRTWLLMTLLLAQGMAHGFNITLNLQDSSGAPLSGVGFRWLLCEDNTVQKPPGVAANDSISLVIHQSHAPVVATGTSASSPGTATIDDAVFDPAKSYYLTVMAAESSVGGARIAPGQNSVNVLLQQHPIPTSQVSVLVFEDQNSINNVPDATEPGLGGFRVIVEDGTSGGQIMQDAFGNPLGTTYRFDPDTGEPLMGPDGSPQVEVRGHGVILTDSNGRALIKYLPPGKFGIVVIPPTGTDWTGGHGAAKIGGQWHQTSTIEGTQISDAWVKANEPAVRVEGFGVGFYHVFFGFVDPDKLAWSVNPPPNNPNNVTVVGQLRYDHFGKPQLGGQSVAEGPPVPEGWVGLNEFALLPGGGIGPIGAVGQGLYVTICDDNGNFTIPNVPPGTYQLVTWDKPLDSIFGFNTITVAPGSGTLDLGVVPCKRWFGTLEGSVFYDGNENGFRDPREAGVPNMAVNLRFRDGRIYAGTVTDIMGDYEMSEVFPFFKWLVAEVDFARFKATGLTAVVDDGGAIPGLAWPAEGVRNPQPQYAVGPDGVAKPGSPINNPNTGNNLSRTETGEVLTQAMHLFLNQNNRIDWGKTNYPPGENGRITGVVFYSTTRAEEDPREAVGDAWEPGIPRVQVVLYADTDQDQVIDDLDGSTDVTLADVDNHPLGWATGGAKGREDVDRDGDGTFDAGDAMEIAWTDSWDDNNPQAIQTAPPVILGKPIVGADGYSTWNQIADGVFDGGFAFFGPSGSGLAVGTYIVQASPPPGYLIQTEESMNVGFGDSYKPSKLWLPPECVGTPANTGLPAHVVPAGLTLFPGEPAPFAGQQRPTADFKWVVVADRNNNACDFHMYTEVPLPARVVGFVLNDLSAEFNAYSPNFGEKASPGWLPISFRDWSGNEIARTYCDEFGTYNALLPSTYTVNVPAPSGVAPNMLTVILNDPTMPDPADATGRTRIPDPNYNPSFAVAPSTWMFWPGSTSYLDTPIVPLAGFAGYPNTVLDTEPQDGTPVILDSYSHDGLGGPSLVGPYLQATSDVLVLKSLGFADVPNPEYGQNTPDLPPMIVRDYGFGAVPGTVTLVTTNGNGVAQTTAMVVASWNNGTIQARLPGTPDPGSSWQLMVTRGDTLRTTQVGLTLTYRLTGQGVKVIRVSPRPPTQADPAPDPIQEAIDIANDGDLILVGKGVYYENPIVYRPLRLQGSGYGTIISANPVPAERTAHWIAKIEQLLGGNPFGTNNQAGVTVLGNPDWQNQPANRRARIDGLNIFGAVTGGGVLAYNETRYLSITNNRIVGNQGVSAGGIQLGLQDNVGTVYQNRDVRIAYNQVFKNGGVNGPGGIGIFNGAENYLIEHNFILGNFSRTNGGGIGHEGVCRGGRIAGNVIANNEVFYGAAVGGDGGGIYIGGEVAAAGGLSSGSGSVTIMNNLIQGNLAGSGRGGGICAFGVNGMDAQASSSQNQWYWLRIINNMIVNNVAGYQAGGIALRDVARSQIVHNTIANNDCTSTAKAAFENNGITSTPQCAGIVSYQHSALLAQYSGQQFANPDLRNNIVYGNQTKYWNANAGIGNELIDADPVVRDLQVVTLAGAGSPLRLNPRFCLLSGTTGYHSSNVSGDPAFVREGRNTLFAAAVLDEAGNNISVRFAPTGLYDLAGAELLNYHVGAGSTAINRAQWINPAPVGYDYDFEVRPNGNGQVSNWDIGADQFNGNLATNHAWLASLLNGPEATGPTAGVPAIPPPGVPVLPPLVAVPLDMDGIDTDGDGIVTNDIAYVRLGAGDGFATMGDGTELYTFGFAPLTGVPNEMAMMAGMLKAQCSSPTLVFREGQLVYLDVTNTGMMMRPDLFDPHTLHFHGFPQASVIYDGEPMGSLAINMGGTFRYFYRIVQPGTFMYHCHVEATEHMEMGMLGNLWVEPKQNFAETGAYPGHVKGTTKFAYDDGDGSTLYHVDAPLQLGAFDREFHEKHIAVQGLPFWSIDESYPMINGRGYPDTANPAPLDAPPTLKDMDPAWPSSQPLSALVTAKVGQKVLLRISSLALSDFHTLTVQGLPMRVVGRDAKLLRGPDPDGDGPLLGKDLSFNTTSVTLGGGESADVIIDTNGAVPGTYFIYDTRLNKLCNDEEDFGGMMTELILGPADAAP